MKNLLTPKAASHVKTINPKAHRSIPFKLNAVSHGLAYTFLAFSLSSIAPVFAQNNGTNGSGTTAGHGGAGVSGSGSGGNGGSGPTRSGGGGGSGGTSGSGGRGGIDSTFGNSGGNGGAVGAAGSVITGNTTGNAGAMAGSDSKHPASGGGGGGVGFWVSGSSSLDNSFNIIGGKGGVGANGYGVSSGGGGGGGAAGIGGSSSFTLNNSGVITGGNGGNGGATTLTNASGGSGGTGGSGIAGGSFTVNNSGTISGGAGGSGGASTGSGGTAGSNGSGGSGIYVLSGSGVSISNLTGGTISGATGAIAAINNAGTINSLVNAQGASSYALTYAGNLPINYSIIVNSPTSYGQLAFTNITGTNFNFGIDASSTLAVGTYSDVLQGLSSINNVTGSSGRFGAYTYLIQYDASRGAANDWSLVVSGGSVAPEMNPSLIPQVGLLLGCLFFMYGTRKKIGSEQQGLQMMS